MGIWDDTIKNTEALLASLKQRLPELEILLAEVNNHWGYEDAMYRFYHQSFKVYFAQEMTRKMVTALQDVMPGRTLNPWFTEIVKQGTTQRFSMETSNQNWLAETRPIVEALTHAKYMLEMGIKYAKAYETPPQMMDSGWALFLYLYGLR